TKEMKILGSFSYSHIHRIIPTLCRLKYGSERIITNNLLNSNYQLFWSKQKRTFTTDHARDDRIKYDHNVKLHTDGFIKTIISNSRELYHNLRDDFRAHWRFNTSLIIVIFSYVGTLIGRFILEYRRVNKELYLKEKQMDLQQKQMDFDHEYKMIELGLKQKSHQQEMKQIKTEKESSSSK
ncbi:unnamed protein product, partial [Rotaria sordida]